jgi:hypothetical protein
MIVYPFISRPQWDWPLQKPRFSLEGEELRLLDQQMSEPSELFSSKQLRRLPHIHYDFGYSRTDWNWRCGPVLLRYLASRWPRWRVPGPEASDDAMVALNTRILNDFAALARSEKSVPLGVFFPSNSQDDYGETSNVLAPRILAGSTLPFVDLTHPLRRVNRGERTVAGGDHLAGPGNLAAATYISHYVREAMAMRMLLPNHAGEPEGGGARTCREDWGGSV